MMLATRAVFHAPSSACASCRLRSAIAGKRLARSRRTNAAAAIPSASRVERFGTSARPRGQQEWERDEALRKEFEDPQAEEEGVQYAKQLLRNGIGALSPEKAALTARETYGARLPEGVLGEEAMRVYERLYGKPLEVEQEVDVEEEDVDEEGGVALMREAADGELEEVEFDAGTDELEEMDREEIEVADELEEDDARLRQDIEAALSTQGAQSSSGESDAVDVDDSPIERAHPLTTASRFGTSPSSLPLPAASIVEPIAAQLTNTNNKHLAQAAHRVLGGVGLPYGPSTPNRLKTMQAKPIQIDAFQHHVSEIEGDVFLAAILPAVCASVVAVLTETRKRMGTKWAEELVHKADRGELRILDAGGGGAGVLAVREMLRAEWERMHEERSTGLGSSLALAEAGGRLGGPGVSPPLGDATVVTCSDVLRRKASKILENTTFIPRLPDYVHTAAQKDKGKFDLVIAPHTLWGGWRFDRERKAHVMNLWGLLDANGGLLCLLEKGVARGFEVIAGAREMLLNSRIQNAENSGAQFVEADDEEGVEIEWDGPAAADDVVEDTGKGWKTSEPDAMLKWEKEKGTIIAPCTNHAACPMYRPRGYLKGRRDICAFEQRYVRPPFLQRILAAKDKNFEDVGFAYLSVMRGRDLLEEKGVEQGDAVTERAFAGYEAARGQPPSLALPRQVFPPLKRKGHVLLDVCTPAGDLERWTVPRSFSRQAFRDARKSGWGDLWALGAKTRISRRPRVDGKHGGRLSKGQRAELAGMEMEGVGSVETGRGGGKSRPDVVDVVVGEGGKMRTGRKVGGVRVKRDKKGKGNGRRKMRSGDD